MLRHRSQNETTFENSAKERNKVSNYLIVCLILKEIKEIKEIMEIKEPNELKE